jgi:hypothetical protein
MRMTYMCPHREFDCSDFEVLCRSGPTDSPGVLETRVLGNGLSLSRRTAREQLADAAGKCRHILNVELLAPFCRPLSSQVSRIGVG